VSSTRGRAVRELMTLRGRKMKYNQCVSKILGVLAVLLFVSNAIAASESDTIAVKYETLRQEILKLNEKQIANPAAHKIPEVAKRAESLLSAAEDFANEIAVEKSLSSKEMNLYSARIDQCVASLKDFLKSEKSSP
jgi:hypothetical protein